MAGYPDFEAFAYSFSRAELSLNRNIYTAISNVSFAQPTTEGVVKGTRPWPLARTEGEMEIGEGTITFSTESERMRFIAGLGDGYRNKIWGLSWILTARLAPVVRMACISCRVLDNPVNHEGGVEALSGEVMFSFLSHTINGKSPHV